MQNMLFPFLLCFMILTSMASNPIGKEFCAQTWHLWQWCISLAVMCTDTANCHQVRKKSLIEIIM